MPPPLPSPGRGGSKARIESKREREAGHFLSRLHLAVFVPGVREIARSIARAELWHRLQTGALRRPAQAPRAARPRGDRAKARLDLSAGALAGPQPWRSNADAGGASV